VSRRLPTAVKAKAVKGLGNQRMAFSVGKWVGDLLFLAGVVGVNRQTGHVVMGYPDLPPEAAERLSSGMLVNDAREGPMAAQAWFVFSQIEDILRREGLSMVNVIRMEQFLTDIRDYGTYNRVRQMFFPSDPPAGTLVEVTALLPTNDARLEVQVTASKKASRTIPWSEEPGRW
jgi:enamine deaminase RidA (YjgF/YER057c/UK114 family)